MEVRSVRDSSLYSLLISSGRNKVLLVILNLSGPYILMMTVSIVFFVVGIFQGTHIVLPCVYLNKYKPLVNVKMWIDGGESIRISKETPSPQFFNEG